MSEKRHRWGKAERTYGSHRFQCIRCHMEKDARFDRNHHWNEYRRPYGEWFVAEVTPKCDAHIKSEGK